MMKWIFAVLLAALCCVQTTFAQFNLEIVGTALPEIRTSFKKANQSQVVFHQGHWWGIFRPVSDSNWHLYKFADDAWQDQLSIPIAKDDQPDAFMDNNRNKMYVIFSTSSKVVRINISENSSSLDSGFPVLLDMTTLSNDPASIARANDGDLFISYAQGDSLRILHSVDDGVTWTSNVPIKQASSALTDLVAFKSGGQDFMGVFVGQGGGEHVFHFYKLADNDDPTNGANWSEETLPTSLVSDDHVNIIKDFDQNLYAAMKLGNSVNNAKFLLMKRTSSGTWSVFNVVSTQAGNTTRPSLTIDETNNFLYFFATVGAIIQYAKLDKDNLSDIASDDWQPVIKNGANSFNNASISYQSLGAGNPIVVVAENDTKGEAWYNTLDVPYTADSDLLISEVNSSDGSLSGSVSFIELFNFSRNTLSLGNFDVKYYDNGATSPSTTKSLSGSLAPLDYLVITNDAAAFQSAYGFSADFEVSGFKLDGGEDAVLLFDGSAAVDGFNNGAEGKVAWSAGQDFQRTNFPNDGNNLFFAYLNSGTPVVGTPGGVNDFPLLKSDRSLTAINDPGETFANIPARIDLQPAYPNPFNPQTRIRFELHEAAPVRVDIFNIAGQLVQQLYNGFLGNGRYEMTWEGKNRNGEQAASGLYILTVQTPAARESQRLVLIR